MSDDDDPVLPVPMSFMQFVGYPKTPDQGKYRLDELVVEGMDKLPAVLMPLLEAAYRCGVVQAEYARAEWAMATDPRRPRAAPLSFLEGFPDDCFASWTEIHGRYVAACHQHIPGYIDVGSPEVDVWGPDVGEWQGIVRCWFCEKTLAAPDPPMTEEERDFQPAEKP